MCIIKRELVTFTNLHSERGEQVDGIADADITLDFAVVALTTSVHCY